MLERTPEVKVLRDPIHGYIHIDLKVVWDCLNTREFQRLRRIHQLGGDFQVYHTAEHTRFSHSLGVYEIVRRMVREIPDIAESFSEYEKCTAMLAGLSDHIKIIPMADDESGTCIIEMPDEIIDASASTQLNNLRDILRGG